MKERDRGNNEIDIKYLHCTVYKDSFWNKDCPNREGKCKWCEYSVYFLNRELKCECGSKEFKCKRNDTNIVAICCKCEKESMY